jgi:RNA polymerase sigma-70 factor (ECF subfamily)
MGGGDPTSDEELVRRVKAGDEAATRELFERHAAELRSRVRRRLPRRVRPKVSESDVIQEAFLAAFLKLGDFEDRGDGSFKGWLGTILERKILDEVRDLVRTAKRDVRREVAAGSSVVRIAGAAPQASPSAAAIEDEERAAVRAEMASMSGSHREVLRLVHEERLSIEDAAARLGRTFAATKKLYGRAVMRLAERMRPGESSD